MDQAAKISETSHLNRFEDENEKNIYDLGIITSGVSYSYVKEALAFLELKAPLLKIGFINPLPTKKIVEIFSTVKNILVVEENDSFIESQVLAIAHKSRSDVSIYGKHSFSYSKDSLLPHVGELNPMLVVNAIINLTKIEPKIKLDIIVQENYNLVKRRAVLCPGCPHRSTGYALKQAVKKFKIKTGKEVYYYQDIGCYTLLAYPPLNFANVKYCMGSSIALAQGVAHTDISLNVAIIGDGTFFHSGIPALLNAIHNRAPILVLLLDNGWIGMTGQQPHPGSDTHHYTTAFPKEAIKLDEFLKGTGANIRIFNKSTQDQDSIVQLRILIYEGAIDVIENKKVNVILIRDECIQKFIQRHKIAIRKIDNNLCKNCGLCYDQFLCPAICVIGKFAFIDPKLCNGCGVCEEICPNNAIKMEELL